MPPKINLKGQRFGKLTVISESSQRRGGGNVEWLCKCECGNEKSIQSASLRNGLTTSCGCYGLEMLGKNRIKHGKCSRQNRSITYTSWDAMIQRCTNPNSNRYKFYGAKGRTVCDRWLHFNLFLEDMGERPSKEHTLDRFPNEKGNYEPNNCRWATQEMQSRNKTSNVWFEHEGIKMILTDWAIKFNIHPSVISRSIKRGKTFSEIYKFYMNKR